jgi:UDP-N-acetylglucosamine 2-epimerase (non-hydrolysing)
LIVFVYGTTAEAIKFAPLARRLRDRGVPYRQWVTLQQSQTVVRNLPALGLEEPDEIIADGVAGRPLAGMLDTARWMLTILSWYRRNSGRLRRELAAEPSVLLVHGDTMTSVVGAFIGRGLGVTVAHVEAGLRSGDWRHPFPEELDRRIVGRVAHIHYAPSEAAVAALPRRDVVFTHGNTAVDALADAHQAGGGQREPFGLVLLHRFEFLNNARLVRETVDSLATGSPLPLAVVVDDHARATIEPLANAVGADRMKVLGKLPHHEFVELLASASFVVTDSGGVQEEVSRLGTPTLIHRKATERSEGLGANVVLSMWRPEMLREFLADYDRWRRPPGDDQLSPSDIIVDDLRGRGYAR